ncbi:MAG: dTDP-4-dehydrorhamnose reductase [Chloroflexota bacterium]
MNIMIIGVNGQLGSNLVQVLSKRSSIYQIVPITHSDLEVTDPRQVQQAIEQYKPDVVVNTAAYHKVDEVESYPELAFAVNAIAPLTLARLCREQDIALLFLSTDYVFGGELNRQTPYTESDCPAPLNVYGVSKLAGEKFIQATWPKHWIVRTSGLYGLRGASGKGGNFVELMLRLAGEGKDIRVVDDQRLSPTYTHELAHGLVNLIEKAPYGLYHLTCSGACSWYEFAVKIFELANLQPNLQPTTSAAFKTAARRPNYSVLANQAIREAGIPPLKAWQDALADYLAERQKISPHISQGGSR